MKYTPLIITLLLCLCIVPAIATSADYTSKYVATSNLPYYANGTLMGSIRAGLNDFTQEIGVRYDYNPLGVNGTFTYYPVLSDGTFEIPLPPGAYTLYLKDGNGGQPEYSHADITQGVISHPEKELLGHAVSQPPAIIITTPTPEPNRKIYILSAYYGARWVTYNNRGSTEHGQYVQVGSLLQHQIDLGQRSFKFDVATITDASGTPLVNIPGGDPVPGIVKNVIVIYTVGNNPFWHVDSIMEQDYHNPYVYPSAQIPYLPISAKTVLNF